MLPDAVLAILNHLIGHTPGASARLAAHAGAHARLACGGIGLSFRVGEDGRFAASENEPAAVTIRLPGDAPLRFAHQGEAVMREARVDGDAALAETLGQVLRSLRWDAAEDLSHVIGDVAAERVVGGARAALALGNDLASRLASSATEYVADEARMLVRPHQCATFSNDVDTLRDDVARLQKRVEMLQRKGVQGGG
jgi:ubiquinone biosynthesis accessory factor UbiJ